MCKPAMHVQRGDERASSDGRRHRVISRAVADNGAVTLNLRRPVVHGWENLGVRGHPTRTGAHPSTPGSPHHPRRQS